MTRKLYQVEKKIFFFDMKWVDILIFLITAKAC